MVQPDPNCLYYGWHVSKDSDGPAVVGQHHFGDSGKCRRNEHFHFRGGNLTVSATYVGNAMCKFAMRNSLDGRATVATPRRTPSCKQSSVAAPMPG